MSYIKPDVCRYVARWESDATGPGYVVRREWERRSEIVAQFIDEADALEYASARNATLGRAAGRRNFPNERVA